MWYVIKCHRDETEFPYYLQWVDRYFIMTYFCNKVLVPLQDVEGCFEDRIDHTMTEPPMKPLLKVVIFNCNWLEWSVYFSSPQLGKTCPIPDRKTTSLKNAKFITSCKFAKISFETLGSDTILLPTGDLLDKASFLSIAYIVQVHYPFTKFAFIEFH